MTGTSAGDTVWISGGASGSSQTYTVSSSSWSGGNGVPPNGGLSGPAVNYQIAQDSSHNGTAVFDGTGGSGYFIKFFSGSSGYFIISGYVTNDQSMHIRMTNNSSQPFVINGPGITLSHINMGNPGQGIDGQGLSHFNMDHCYCYITGNTSDHFLSMDVEDTALDSDVMATNTIWVPHGASSGFGSGDGADAFQIYGRGWSFYGNSINGYDSGYNTGSQHQDGIQSLSIYDTRIVGNTFNDCGNTSVFLDDTQSGHEFTNVWVNNNICTVSSIWTVYPNGILFLPQKSGTSYFVNCMCANNTAADMNIYSGAISTSYGYNFGGSSASSWINTIVDNNVSINSGIIGFLGGTSAIIKNDNVALAANQGSTNFVAFTTSGGTNNNYHLLATAVSLVGQGTNLTTSFITDFSGNTRVATGAWDVGAYAYIIRQPPH